MWIVNLSSFLRFFIHKLEAKTHKYFTGKLWDKQEGWFGRYSTWCSSMRTELRIPNTHVKSLVCWHVGVVPGVCGPCAKRWWEVVIWMSLVTKPSWAGKLGALWETLAQKKKKISGVLTSQEKFLVQQVEMITENHNQSNVELWSPVPRDASTKCSHT